MNSWSRIYIYGRFNDQGLRAITLMLDTATEAGHSEAGTLHLLLGILLVEDGAGSAILRDFRLPPALVRGAAEALAFPRRADAFLMTFTRRAFEAIWIAGLAARRRKRYRRPASAGTTHLLLALVLDPESEAMRFLQRQGVNRELLLRKVREELRREHSAQIPHK